MTATTSRIYPFDQNRVTHCLQDDSVNQTSSALPHKRQRTKVNYFSNQPSVLPTFSPTPVLQNFDVDLFDINNFERDPFAAEYVFAINTGLHIFDAVSELFGATNTIDTSDPNVEKCIDQIIEDNNENLSVDDLGRIMDDYKSSFDLTAPLFGCASCGIREFQMGLENINRFEDWNLADLTKFKKTPEQYAAWLKIKHAFRPILSCYKGCDSQIYNFHPECVSSKLDSDGKLVELVKLCPVCSNCAANPEQGFPRYSIANGIDYGVYSRLHWLKPLSLSEEHAISLTRTYGCIVKLSGYTSSECQSAKKGHFIFFRQPQAAQQMADATSPDRPKVLPDVSEIEKYIGITFVGADQAWKSLTPNRFRNIDDLKIRPDRIYDWLEVLQAVHPSYANIIIDDSRYAIDQLTSITDKLILHAEVLSSEMEINIDKVATERPANQPVTEDEMNEAMPSDTEKSVNSTEPPIPSTSGLTEQDLGETGTNDETEPMEMHASFLTQSDPRQKNDKDEATRNVLRGLQEAFNKKGPSDTTSNLTQ